MSTLAYEWSLCGKWKVMGGSSLAISVSWTDLSNEFLSVDLMVRYFQEKMDEHGAVIAGYKFDRLWEHNAHII